MTAAEIEGTELTVWLPGVGRDDPRLDALMDLAMESVEDASVTSETRAPMQIVKEPVEAGEPGMVRKAQFALYPRQLARLLDLPEGIGVRAVYGTSDPVAICVVVEGGSLPWVDDRMQAPMVNGSLSTSTWVAPDGKPYIRWGWTPDYVTDNAAEVTR